MKFSEIYKITESKVSNFKNNNYAKGVNDPELRKKIKLFYTKFANGRKSDEEQKIDWGNSKEFTNETFAFVNDYFELDLDENGNKIIEEDGLPKFKFKNDIQHKSNSQLKTDSFNKRATAEEMFSNKNLFHIYEDISNEDWLFVSPLNYEACKYINSISCGGFGARWCIGWIEDGVDEPAHWENYMEKGTRFVLAFNKHFKDDEIQLTDDSIVNLKEPNRWNITSRYNGEGLDDNKVCNYGQMLTKFMFEIPKDMEDLVVWIQPDFEYKFYQVQKLFEIDFGVEKEDILNLDFSVYDKATNSENRMFDNLKRKGCIINKERSIVKTPNTWNTIEEDAFNSLEIKKIEITDNITSIENRAFYNCNNLMEVKFSSNLTNIGNNAFNGCVSLNNINLPNKLDFIGNNAFAESSIQSLYIPDNVTFIGKDAFRGCKKLEKAKLSDDILSLSRGMFQACINLEEVKLPKYLDIIEDCVFWGTKIKEIILPDKVRIIGFGNFMDCPNLESVYIPDSVTKIDGSNFRGCDNLKTISIPKNLNILLEEIPNTCKIIRRDSPNNIKESKTYIFSKIYHKFN